MRVFIIVLNFLFLLIMNPGLLQPIYVIFHTATSSPHLYWLFFFFFIWPHNRTQGNNRDACIKKLKEIISEALIEPKERVIFEGISDRNKTVRKIEKRARSVVKANRSSRGDDWVIPCNTPIQINSRRWWSNANWSSTPTTNCPWRWKWWGNKGKSHWDLQLLQVSVRVNIENQLKSN